MEIRDASENDGADCAAIYEPYVRDTAITFETVPPTAEEMSGRIARSLRDHAWVVAQEGSAVVGYAYGGLYKERAAYAWACEVSVYLSRACAAPAWAGCSTRSCSPAWPAAAT